MPFSVTEATSSTTLAPAGIDAPFDPETVFATVATKRSPGRLDDEQIRCCEFRASIAPAPMLAWPASDDGAVDGAAAGARSGCCTGSTGWVTGCRGVTRTRGAFST